MEQISKESNSQYEVTATQHRKVLESTMPIIGVDGGALDFTEDGNDALRRGSEIYGSVRHRDSYLLPPSLDLLESKVGKMKMIDWFGTFYQRMMNDPRMAVLFDTRHEEANVSAAEHGKRLSLLLWSRWTDDPSSYIEISQSLSPFHRIQKGHQRAKQCPMRSKPLRGRGFTTGQRDSWLGHLWYAGEKCGVPLEVNDQVVHHLATLIGLYGPFVDTEYEA
jgi:truncated hemoglobin YjbI